MHEKRRLSQGRESARRHWLSVTSIRDGHPKGAPRHRMCPLHPPPIQARSKPARTAPPQLVCLLVRRWEARCLAGRIHEHEPWPAEPAANLCRQASGLGAHGAQAFAFRRLVRRRAWDTISIWLRAARPRNWNRQCRVNGRLGVVPNGKPICQAVDAAAISL